MQKRKEERQAAIYQLLLNDGRLSVKDLASRLHVTPETIRSNLTDLDTERRVV